jgi:NAD(P)H-dependent FMN reductase
MMPTRRVLAISGSLRRVSSNSALVRAVALLAPADVEIAIYDGLADLPAFNPDLDGDIVADPVSAFRSALDRSDAVLISSPEYAHGVPGALKNALDWVVGSGELIDKPVALINASPSSSYAHASLAETLKTMSAMVVPEASITVPLKGRSLDDSGIAADSALSSLLRSALDALLRAVTPDGQGARQLMAESDQRRA